MLLALGSALVVAGCVLSLFRGFFIRNWTSRSLGSLAPGFAATRVGYTIYALLVVDLGFVVLALDAGSAILIIVTVVAFVVGSLAVVVGEAMVYRNLKR